MSETNLVSWRLPRWLREKSRSIARYLVSSPIECERLPPPASPEHLPDGTFMSGPYLIGLIETAIELGQSVVLTGPRGAGKSYCVRAAINACARRGIVPVDSDGRPAYVFIQGNKEIPRDYLAEDEITFVTKTDKTSDGGAVLRVVPGKRHAPLFRYAERDPVTDEPIIERGVVKCSVAGKPCERFVLFLDEINRFSDGVLDSLLSLLEEREAVLAGVSYRLPVVVVMTMNPPGYDGSARKLSPPLAARIGRNYRLLTPDLDTLSYEFIHQKMDERKRHYDDQALLLSEEVRIKRPSYPRLPSHLVRRVALLTLCCWGDPAQAKPAYQYMDLGTKRLLKQVMRANGRLMAAMQDLGNLCAYGPDGRAASDWLTAAIGRELAHAASRGVTVARELDKRFLHETVVEAIAHKLYDNFNPASTPEKTLKKEVAVKTICEIVLESADLVGRASGESGALTDAPVEDPIQKYVDSFDKLPDLGPDVGPEDVRRAFIQCGVTANSDVQAWKSACESLGRLAVAGGGQGNAAALRILYEFGLVTKGDVGLRSGRRVISDGWSHARHGLLAQELAKKQGLIAGRIKAIADPAIGAVPCASVLLPLDLCMRRFEIVRILNALNGSAKSEAANHILLLDGRDYSLQYEFWKFAQDVYGGICESGAESLAVTADVIGDWARTELGNRLGFLGCMQSLVRLAITWRAGLDAKKRLERLSRFFSAPKA